MSIASLKMTRIVRSVLVVFVSAFYVADAQAAPFTFSTSVIAQVGTSQAILPCVTTPDLRATNGGAEQTDAFATEIFDLSVGLPHACGPSLGAFAIAGSHQLTGSLHAAANASGWAYSIASAQLDVIATYTNDSLRDVPLAVTHIKEEMLITGHQDPLTDWFACIGASGVLQQSGFIQNPDCDVRHYGNGANSPVSMLVSVDFDVFLAYGVSGGIALGFLLEAEGYGALSNITGQPVTQEINLFQSAHIRQTLEPGVTFATDSGFLSESPFNSPTSPDPVPEPTSLVLIGTGVIGAGVRRYRRQSN